MGPWSDDTPKQLSLLEWEQAERTASIAATHSDSPPQFVPLVAPSPVYTHVGHDAQYRAVRRDGRTVRILIMHTTETDSFTGSMRYSARRSSMVSCTAHTGKDGEIGLNVPEESVPWTTGRWNDESLSLEICGKRDWTEAEWRARPKQIEATIVLLVDWCKRFDIPVRWLSPEEIAEGASMEGTPPVQGINRGISDHWECNLAARLVGRTSGTSHNDIGPALKGIFLDTILPEVERRLNADAPPSPSDMIVLDAPIRILDTRKWMTGIPALGQATVSLPEEYKDARGVFVNLTVVPSSKPGHLTAWNGVGERPTASNLNYNGATICNTSWVPVHDGRFMVFAHSETHLIVDLQAIAIKR